MGAGPGRGEGESYRDSLPGSLEGIAKHYADRGYQADPGLESDEGQVASFVHKIPDGRRVHVKVFRGPKYYTVDKHIDSADPEVNPIGHIQDIVFSPDHRRTR